MSKIRCVRRNAAAGRLSDQDHARLEHVYSTTFADAKATGASDGEAERLANEQFDRTLTRIAQQARRVSQLQKEAETRLLSDAAQFKSHIGQTDLGEYGQHVINKVFFESHALFRQDMAELASLAHEFRRTWHAGNRLNPTTAIRMLREIFGQDTGDATAKALADAWRPLSRRKIEQFNNAGGDVAVREDWHVPQRHDSISIARADFENWRKVVLDTVDPSRMINSETGLAFKPHEFDAVLKDVFNDIVWRGLGSDAEVHGGQGMALWRRRNDPRFFVFKDADAWMRYHQQFGGNGHIYEVMADYLRSINHDIAAMQRFGPNPNRTVEWLAGRDNAEGGLIMHHARLADEGKASLFPARRPVLSKNGKDFAPFKTQAQRQQYAMNKAEATLAAWRQFTGEARRPVNRGWAFVEGTLSNLVYMTKLPFTPFLVGGDIVNQAATRAFTGVAVRTMMRDFVDALKLAPNRKAISELGIEVDAGLSTLHSEARDAAVIHGSPTIRYLTDRTVTFTGLKPLTMALRAMWTLGVLHEVTRRAGTAFERLPRDFRAALAKHDIGPAEWAHIQAAPVTDRNGVRTIRPLDIAGTDLPGSSVVARPGLTQGQEVATRLMTLIQSEGEAATISGTPRSARVLQRWARPGTLRGTILGSYAKLKTYSISHFQHHAYRAAEIFAREGGGVRGMAQGARYYALGLVIPSMVLVGMGTVLADMAQGKDAPDVTDWAFWNRIYWKTISLGFFQDFLQNADPTENAAQHATQMAGASIGILGDIGTVAGDAFQEGTNAAGITDRPSHIGRHAIRAARDFVPRTWATDLAMDRLFWDNVQRMVDPEADADFARRAARSPQGMWWAPGSGISHAPDLSTLDLTDQNQSAFTERRQ